MDPFKIAGAGLGLFGTIAGAVNKGITARRQRRLADKINPVDPNREISDTAFQGLARANNLYNARMAGAGAMEDNIATSAANRMAAVERNSTSAADNMAMAAAGEAAANQQYADLQQRENINRVAMNDNLSRAEGVMRDEEQAVFMDKLRKYTEAVEAKNNLMQASQLNRAGMFSDIAQGGLMMFGAGMNTSKRPVSGGLGMVTRTPQTVTRTPLTAGMSAAATAPRTISYVPMSLRSNPLAGMNVPPGLMNIYNPQLRFPQ